MSQSADRLDALTGLRGVAAWWVVFFHIGPAFGAAIPAGLKAFWGRGYLAVDLFFILSGFVMWLTYAVRFQELGWGYSREFIARRLARIYPLHFATMVFAIWFVFLWWVTGRSVPSQYPLAQLPLHFLLIQNWGFTDRFTWNDPAWSISTELGAYLILAAIGPVMARWRPRIAVVCAVLIALVATFATALTGLGERDFNAHVPRWGLLRCILEFFIGTMLCMVWQRRNPRTKSWMLWGCISLGLAATRFFFASFWWSAMAVPLFFSALILLLALTSEARLNPFSSRIAIHLGEISYSVYLTHFLIWVYLKVLVIKVDYDTPIFYLFLLPALVYGVSLFCYRVIELPGRRAVQRALTA